MRPRSTPDYRQDRNIESELGGVSLRLVTRPGFPEWGHISEAARLIAEQARLEPGERVLICPCGHGALGVWAGSRVDSPHITLRDTNIVAVEAARRTMGANHCAQAQVEVGLPEAPAVAYDVVLMTLPKGRDLARLLFLYSFGVLREGGRLYLAGPNDEGIKSAIKDCAELFGPERLLAYKRSNRVVWFTRGPASQSGPPENYRVPGLASGTFNEFEVQVQGSSYAVCTRPGVFAWRGLDAGTRLLLDVLEVRVTDVVLDVGCGYGIIGMAAARQALNGQVTLVDVDWLACECARASLRRSGIGHAEVLLGDGLAAVDERAFTLIVSNPPFHSGHAISYDTVEAFVREAYAALEPRGRLVIVANRFLPYDRLMAQVFGPVVTLAQTPQYHVLSAEKSYQRKTRGKVPRARRASNEDAELQIPPAW